MLKPGRGPARWRLPPTFHEEIPIHLEIGPELRDRARRPDSLGKSDPSVFGEPSPSDDRSVRQPTWGSPPDKVVSFAWTLFTPQKGPMIPFFKKSPHRAPARRARRPVFTPGLEPLE